MTYNYEPSGWDAPPEMPYTSQYEHRCDFEGVGVLECIHHPPECERAVFEGLRAKFEGWELGWISRGEKGQTQNLKKR